MSTRTIESKWRSDRVQWYGKPIREYITDKFKPGQAFNISLAAQADCLNNLAERYAYDVTVAVLYDLQLQGVLARQGRNYVFPMMERINARRKSKNRTGK